MAKSKAFFGLRKGSTKSHTFQVYRGEQVTKDRVSTVANPQTQSQGDQRLRLASVAAATARLETLINHAWQGVEYGYKSVAEFRKENLAAAGTNIYSSYGLKGYSDPGLSTLRVSKGMLPTVAVQFNTANLGYTFLAPSLKGFALQTNLDNNPTVDAALISAITDASGLQEGDQITFLAQLFKQQMDKSEDGQPMFDYRPTACYVVSRFVLDPDSDYTKKWGYKQLKEEDSSDFGKYAISDGVFSIYNSADTNDGMLTIEVNMTSNTQIAATGAAVVGAAAVILSRKVGDVWQRSTQNLVVNTAFEPKISAQNAWKTYVKASSKSAKYLNSGADGLSIIGGE